MPNRLFASLVSVCLSLLFMLPLQAAPSPAQTPQGDVPDIFGGREAQPGAWPWQAALVSASQADAYFGQYCGGTLIDPEWVVTAAHCVDGTEPQALDVVLGRHRLSTEEGERIAAAQIVVHPEFTSNPFSFSFDPDGDIALIRLSTPSNQQPIALFSGKAGEEEVRYVGGTATGWGLTEQFSYPDALHEVVVPLVAPILCTQIYGEVVTEEMLCAGYPKGNKDSCYGDSGGPLVVHSQDEGNWQQVGIVSWGSACGLYGSPGVYTRIASFKDWIDSCLTDMTSRDCTGFDLYEPDDQPQQATLIQSDSISQTHHFHDAADRDRVKFEAQRGKSYRIEVQPLGVQSDPLIWLYGSDGISPIAYNDDGGNGKAAQLIWHATGDAIVYIEIQDVANGRGVETAYSVVIQQVMPIYLPLVAP